MKRLFLALIPLSLLSIACDDTTVSEEIAPRPEHIVISAKAPDSESGSDDASTRTALGDNGRVQFVETDALSVFDAELNNCRFTVSELYTDGTADFEGTAVVTEERQPAIFYPYDSELRAELYGPSQYKQPKIYFTIPSTQTAVAGSFDPSAAVSAGLAGSTGDGIFNVRMRNLNTLVKFTLPEGTYSKAVLRTNGGEGISGGYTVTIRSEELDLQELDACGEITLQGPLTGGVTYMIAAAPVTAASGITITAYGTDGLAVLQKSTSRQVVFERSALLNAGLVIGSGASGFIGRGTESDPYIIQDLEHLQLLAICFSSKENAAPYAGKYFRQTADIDALGNEICIGNFSDEEMGSYGYGSVFNAHYDGGGHKISNYRMKLVQGARTTSRRVAGLFSVISDGSVSNLSVQPAIRPDGLLVNSLDYTDESYYIGLLAGVLAGNATVTGCHSLPADGGMIYYVSCTDASSLSSSTKACLGGLVGFVYGSANISWCDNTAGLKLQCGEGLMMAGGLIGWIYEGLDNNIVSIDRCSNDGRITVTSAEAEVFAGGVAGRASEDCICHISNCVNYNVIEATTTAAKNACAGGIMGSHYSDGTGSRAPWFYNCLNKGYISASGGDDYVFDTSTAMAGGICGYCYDSDTVFALCVNVGQIVAYQDPSIAPITTTGGTQVWCYWTGFEGYEPSHGYNSQGYYFISGTGSGDDTPEYIRLNGKTNEPGDTFYDRTEWSQSQWAAAASWSGTNGQVDLVF